MEFLGIVAIFFFIVFIIPFVSGLTGHSGIMKLYGVNYCGVFLSTSQIKKLEQREELPIAETPVFLHLGEVAVYYCEATRIESGRRNNKYRGELVITNERVIFLCDKKGFELKHNNIIAASADKNGFTFQSRSTAYRLLVPYCQLAVIAFDGVRVGDIPISGSQILEDDLDDRPYARGHAYHDEIENEEKLDFSDPMEAIDDMDGHEFEYFCAEVLRRNGFSDVHVTKGSGDQGVDVLATKDGIKYAIQCKNYATPLSNTPIQEVSAGKLFYNCHVGAVMTNSTFTPGAKSLAQATGILLWDRSTLQKMIINASHN